MKKCTILLFTLFLIITMISCSEIDRSELESALSTKYEEKDYTAEAYSLYLKKYENALAVMNDDGASETQIRLAAEELNSAIASLKNNKRANFALLESVLSEKYEESDYLPDCYAEYKSAYEMAQNVFDNKDSRQSAVNSAVKFLRDKINALVKKADSSELEKLIETKYDENKYTKGSYERYKVLYEEAETLCKQAVDPEYASSITDIQAYIKLCATQLQEAIKALVPLGNTDKLAEKYEEAFGKLNDSVGGVAPGVYYTEESYKILKDKTDYVKEAIYSNNLSQNEINTLIDELQNAIDGLKVSDYRQGLYTLINEIQEKYLSNRDDFTEESYIALHTAVNEAIDEYNSATSTKASIAYITEKLNSKVDSLVYVVVKGTGKTDFNFNSTQIKVENQGITFAQYFVNMQTLINILSETDGEIISSVSADKKTYQFIDGSMLVISSNSIVLTRNEVLTQDVIPCVTIAGMGLDTQECNVVAYIGGKNPTGYYSEGNSMVFVYTDAANGYTITIKHSLDDSVINYISVTYTGSVAAA